jgi:hypothetical protein
MTRGPDQEASTRGRRLAWRATTRRVLAAGALALVAAACASSSSGGPPPSVEEAAASELDRWWGVGPAAVAGQSPASWRTGKSILQSVRPPQSNRIRLE